MIDLISKNDFSFTQMFLVVGVSLFSIVIMILASVLPSLVMIKYETKEQISLIQMVQFISPGFLDMVGSTGLYYGMKNIANDLSFIAYPAVLNIILSTMQAFIVLILLYTISVKILILTVILWILYISIIIISGKQYKVYVKKIRELEPELSKELNSILSNINIITKFGNEKFYLEKYEQKLNSYNKIREKMDSFMQMQSTLLTYINAICFASFILVSLPSISDGSFTKGMLVMVLSYIPLLMLPLEKYQFFFKIKGWILESEANKNELLAECNIPKLKETEFVNLIDKKSFLELNNVSFSYDSQVKGDNNDE